MRFADKFIHATNGTAPVLENRLTRLLRPITPRSEFVHGLGKRIKTIRAPAIVNRFSNIQFFLVLIAGVLSLSVLVVMIARSLFPLLGVRRCPQRQT